MILKKPFAFLIKYFRIIHLILLIPMIYIAIKTTNIAIFLNNYVNSNYSYNLLENTPIDFINNFIYFMLIIVLIIAITIFILMKHKNKPIKVYQFIIVYYALIVIIIPLTFNILHILENGVIIAKNARAFRDIGLIVIIPQYLCILLVFIRGIGFDVKKFNFALDLKEMEISTEDNEEFEFTIGIDNYKAKRNFKRFIREFRYYIKENTFIFAMLFILSIGSLGMLYYFNYDVIEKTYGINEPFSYKNLKVSIKDAIITNLDYKNEIISKDKNYLAISVELNNIGNMDVAFNYNDYRIYLNNSWIYPILTNAVYFKDLGINYTGYDIPFKSNNNYIIVYELDENVKDTYELKIYNSNIKNKLGKTTSNYTTVKLNPKTIWGITNTIISSAKNKVLLSNTSLKDSSIIINESIITDKYNYQVNGVNKIINIDYSLNKNVSKLMIIDYHLILDETTMYYQNIKNTKNFFEDFLSIKYVSNNQEYFVKPIIRNFSDLDKLVLQVPNNVSKATNVYLLLTIRNNRYSITIK